MPLSQRAKTLILVIIVVLVAYFLLRNYRSEPINNEGMLTQDASLQQIQVSQQNTDQDSIMSLDTQSSGEADFNKKMTTRDSAKNGYKASNYQNGRRGNTGSSLDQYFEGNHPNDQGANNGFSASDENGGKYAAYLSDGNNKKLSEKDKFDPVSLLPQEKNGEWFDDPYETTNVKSSHLINIYRPVGVNTISTTMKNAGHDIRGTVPNPKYAVSPWSNSSIEPDNNIRSQGLCA